MSTAMLYDGALGFMANMPKDAVLKVLLTDAQYTPAPMHKTPDDIPRCAIVSAVMGEAKHSVICVTTAGATRLLMAATYQPGAQECASSPQRGSKEQAHGQHPV